MSTEVETIVKELGLENARIQVGRERIYPPRDGLVVSPKAIEQLKAALSSPDAVKGTIKITEGETTKFWVSKGVVNVPLNPQIEEQTKAVNLAKNVPQPAPEAQPIATSVDVKPEIDSETPQQTYLALLKKSPAFEGVDVTYEDLQALSLEAMKPLDMLVLKSASQNNLGRDEAESIIGAASPYIQASVDKIQASGEILVTTEFISASEQTQVENTAARDTYFDLFKQHPDFKYLNVTTREELLAQPVSVQQKGDRQVSEMALERKLPREQVDRVIAQGSPYIEKELEAGSLSTVQGYLTERSVEYQHRLDTPTVTQEETSQAVAVPVPLLIAPLKEYDFPTDAVNHTAPVQGFAATVQTQFESAQATVIAAKENLELAQKNLAIFAKQVKHRGFKAWAKDQMPILKEKAQEIAAQQGTKLRDWAKKQAPVVKDAAIKTAKQVGHEVAVTTEIVGAVAMAAGRVVADAAVEKGKELGAKAWEKFEKATQLVDPVTLDPALKSLVTMYGKEEGFFSGGEVDYRTEKGRVNVYAKDGTPVYVDGRLNPNIDGRFVDRLNRVSGNLKEVQAQILKTSTVQAQQTPVPHQQPREKAKGFGR